MKTPRAAMREMLERLLRSADVPNPERAETLWAEYRAGGDGADAAFATLLAWHGLALYRRIWGFVRSDAADDVFQDVLAGLHRERANLTTFEHALRWLRTVAVTRCVDAHRRGVRRKARELAAAVPTEAPTPALPFESEEALRVALSRLSKREQQAVALVYFEGMTRQDAAAALGVQRNTFAKVLDGALARLRNTLATAAVAGTAATTATIEAALGTRPLPPSESRLAELAAGAWEKARTLGRPAVGPWWLPGNAKLLAGVVVGGLVAVSLALVSGNNDMPTASPKQSPRSLNVEQLEPRDVPSTAGLLDPTFGTGGFITTPGFSTYDVTVQPDGKTVSVGNMAGDFRVVRLTATGTPDPTFGTDGVARTDLAGSVDSARAVAIQSDGKIVVTGRADVTIRKNKITQNGLVRYNANGTLDTTFGNGGKVTTAGTGGIADVAIDASGRIVTVGVSGTGSMRMGDLMVCRYLPNGTLDATFGSGGKVAIDFNGRDDGGRSLVIQPDGRIVVSGWAQVTETGLDARAAVIRLNPNGTLDTSFDGDGKMFPTRFYASNTINPNLNPSVALQPDGRIVLGGYTLEGALSADTLVARFNADGTPDASFGTGGMTQTNFGSGFQQMSAVAVQADGKVVLVGSHTAPGVGQLGRCAVARFTADGLVDTAFGTNGLTSFQPGPNSGGSNHSVALAPDGKIVAAGLTVVSRYLAE